MESIKIIKPAISDAVRKDLEANIEMPKENVIDLDNLDTVPSKILLAIFLVSPRREYVYNSVFNELWRNRNISFIVLKTVHESYEEDDYSCDNDDSDDSYDSDSNSDDSNSDDSNSDDSNSDDSNSDDCDDCDDCDDQS